MEFHQILAIGSFPVLMLMLFAGFPITFTFMFIGLGIGYIAMGDLVFRLMNIHFYQVMTHQVFAAIPFFLFMGFFVGKSRADG
jgi:TRAP-type mannitol/chloroaromatic compound transport system permease large subunit